MSKGGIKDSQIQAKLNKLAMLAQELQEEAERRYGKGGFLFYECEGQFHMMSGDNEESISARQEFVKASKPNKGGRLI